MTETTGFSKLSGFPADVAYERGEFGADTSEAGPVAWIVF
jgi:hypothetical protein